MVHWTSLEVNPKYHIYGTTVLDELVETPKETGNTRAAELGTGLALSDWMHRAHTDRPSSMIERSHLGDVGNPTTEDRGRGQQLLQQNIIVDIVILSADKI